MKEELICRLNNLIAFIENKDNYFAMFGHVIESCSAANEINRLVWDIGHISDACFMDNNERISKSKTEAIKAHLDLTIRYLEKSETKHTVKSLVSTIYNDIYQVAIKE